MRSCSPNCFRGRETLFKTSRLKSLSRINLPLVSSFSIRYLYGFISIYTLWFAVCSANMSRTSIYLLISPITSAGTSSILFLLMFSDIRKNNEGCRWRKKQGVLKTRGPKSASLFCGSTINFNFNEKSEADFGPRVFNTPCFFLSQGHSLFYSKNQNIRCQCLFSTRRHGHLP